LALSCSRELYCTLNAHVAPYSSVVCVHRYLEGKSETEYSGVETFVDKQLKAKSQDWLPVRTTFAAQNLGFQGEIGGEGGSGGAEKEALALLEERLGAKLEGALKRLDEKVEALAKSTKGKA